MEKIYSNVEPNKLLHVINRVCEIEGRQDVIPAENFIQCATLRMPMGKTFRPHKHITKERIYKNQIADVCKISEVTINKCYKKLESNEEIL